MDALLSKRLQMVEKQIASRGVTQRSVLRALEAVPRHRFVPEAQWEDAYEDHPVTIGKGQTMSQPYVVAYMTELLELGEGDRVLEIGTGSGYHAAVLSRVAGKVFSVEIIESLAESARETLGELGYDNVEIRVGDGHKGWPEAAPFDAIVLTAAPEKVPQSLIDQLKVGGRMVAPVGKFVQDLLLITKTANGVVQESTIPVRFVPMVGDSAFR